MKPGKELRAAREPRVGHPCSGLCLGIWIFLQNCVSCNQKIANNIKINIFHAWTKEPGDTGGIGGSCPHFSKSRAKCPFLCYLVALLEDSDDAKITSEIHVSSDFTGSKFQNFPGSMPPDPLS